MFELLSSISFSRIVIANSYRCARIREATAVKISRCSQACATPQRPPPSESLNLVRFGRHGINHVEQEALLQAGTNLRQAG